MFARPARTVRRAPRLRVEGLERRDVPALYWTGEISNDARNPANWWHGDTAYDSSDLFFLIRPASFMQPAFGQRECVGLTGSYNSITVAESFNHRIVLGANPEAFVPDGADPSPAPEPAESESIVSVNALYLDAPLARIDQYHPWSGAVTAFQVNPAPIVGPWLYPAAFVWYAGTFNSTEHASTVTVEGSTAYIDPFAGDGTGTVNIGSSVRLLSGAVASFLPGDVQFNRGEGLYVRASTSTINTHVQFTRGAGADGPGQLYLAENSVYHVVRTNVNEIGLHHVDMAVFNDGGEFTVDGGIRVEIAQRTAANPGVSFTQYDGITTLTGGSTIVAPDGVVVLGGALDIHINAFDTRADIEGNLTLDGGVVSIYQPSGVTGASRGTFRVVGDVSWLDGLYFTSFAPTVTNDVYTWQATGQFYISSAAAMRAEARTWDDPTDGLTWRVLRAAQFTGPMTSSPSALLTGAEPVVRQAAAPNFSVVSELGAEASWFLKYSAPQ